MTRRIKGTGYIVQQGKAGMYFGILREGKKVHRIPLSTNEREANRLWKQWLVDHTTKTHGISKKVEKHPLEGSWDIVENKLRLTGISEECVYLTKLNYNLVKKEMEKKGKKYWEQLEMEDVGEVLQPRKLSKGKNLSSGSKNRILSTVKKILRCLNVSLEPLEYFKRFHGEEKHHVPLTNEEISRIRQAALEEDEELLGIIDVALNTGMRLKDCVFLKVDSFRFGKLFVTPFKTRHSAGTEVEVPCNAGLLEVFKRAKPANGYFFPHLVYLYNSSRHKLQRRINKIWVKAGVGQMNGTSQLKGFHAIRTTVATRLSEQGLPNGAIASIVGHTNISMTQTYISPSDEIKLNAMNKLDYSKDVPQSSTNVIEEPKQELPLNSVDHGGNSQNNQTREQKIQELKQLEAVLKRYAEVRKELGLPPMEGLEWSWDVVNPPPK